VTSESTISALLRLRERHRERDDESAAADPDQRLAAQRRRAPADLLERHFRVASAMFSGTKKSPPTNHWPTDNAAENRESPRSRTAG